MSKEANPKEPQGKCFIFHNWTRWEQYDQRMQFLAYKTGITTEGVEYWQKRSCTKCGYEQREEIK